MISGGTLQSLAAAAGDDDAAAIADPAALITDPALAAEVRQRSPITVAPRRGRGRRDRADGAGGVHQPGGDPPHGGAPPPRRRAAEPFRYREGLALGGGAATLPLRYAAAGVLSGTQAAVRAAARARPSVRQRVGRHAQPVLPSSGFGPSGERLEQWNWRMSVEARTTGGRTGARRHRRRRPPRLSRDRRMLGEAGLLLAEPGATPDRAGCLTPGDGARHRSASTASSARGARFAVTS